MLARLGAKRSACDLGAGAPKRRKAAPARPRARAPRCERATPRKAPQQRLLDLGQRSLGARRECGACGLVYVVGDPADEAAHASRCDVVASGVRVEGFRDERVAAAHGDGRVLEVRRGDGAAKVAKVEAVREAAGRDLGEAGGAGWARAYVYVAGRRAVGLAVVEALEAAAPTRGGLAGALEPCRLGVASLWTLAAHRRRGVATRLLDAARRSFFFGFDVEKRDVATSHLTEAGRAFFAAYAPGRRLVYAPRDAPVGGDEPVGGAS